MTDTFEPTIIGFTCNWCSYRAADLAGTARMKYPPNVRLIRLMCSGRLDPTFVFKALGQRRGWRDDHRLPSRRMPLHRTELQGPAPLPSDAPHARRVSGSSRAAFELVWASAAEGAKFAAEVTIFRGRDPALGPLHWGQADDAERISRPAAQPKPELQEVSA